MFNFATTTAVKTVATGSMVFAVLISLFFLIAMAYFAWSDTQKAKKLRLLEEEHEKKRLEQKREEQEEKERQHLAKIKKINTIAAQEPKVHEHRALKSEEFEVDLDLDEDDEDYYCDYDGSCYHCDCPSDSDSNSVEGHPQTDASDNHPAIQEFQNTLE